MDVGSFIVKTSDSLNKRQYTKGTYSYFKKLSEEEYAKQPSNSAISKLDILINAACINSKLQGIFLDTGNNLAWSCNILSRINRRLPPIFSSWNNTPMGYSLPAAIGFCLASDRQPTMAVIGDGGLALCMSELAMVKKLNLPLLIIVVENNGHNIQKQTIDTWLEGNYSVVDESTNLFLPSFERIGEFFNIPSFSIDSNFDEESIYNLNLTSDRPTIVKIQISDDARSYPIVLFGNKITECIVQ